MPGGLCIALFALTKHSPPVRDIFSEIFGYTSGKDFVKILFATDKDVPANDQHASGLPLGGVSGGRDIAAPSSPIDVNVFALGILLVGIFGFDFEGVSAKVVSLSL